MMQLLYNRASSPSSSECAAIRICKGGVLYEILFIIFSPISMVGFSYCWLRNAIVINCYTLVIMSFYTTRKSQNSDCKNNYSFHGINLNSKL